jgi:phosphohistidine phosphatase SixA
VTSVLLRHASAGDRDDWDGDDESRPLDARGISSPAVRCVQTVEPLAGVLGLGVEHDPRLAEGTGRSALELLHEEGVVCCTHGDVIEDVLGHGLKKGAAVLLQGGEVVREIRPG